MGERRLQINHLPLVRGLHLIVQGVEEFHHPFVFSRGIGGEAFDTVSFRGFRKFDDND
jgi:hypothetical protein